MPCTGSRGTIIVDMNFSERGREVDNGCVWFVGGTNAEPVAPSRGRARNATAQRAARSAVE